jgi:uncharacterized protein with HEPN domain
VSPRNWRFRLEDINDALDSIQEYVDNLDYAAWLQDKKTFDAVLRNLEIIGEAATHVPDDIQEQHADIPWYQMKAMRNILIHQYFGVDKEVLWRTIQEDIPPLKRKIQKMLLSLTD